MAFYNMQNGDAPLFKKLADEYTISDNYHQPAQGGTGIQHVFLGTGDNIFWSDGNGNPAMPPSDQIANPNPLSGTNNQYTSTDVSPTVPISLPQGCCRSCVISILCPMRSGRIAKLAITTC